jgi:hypothetical protein
MWYAMAHRRTSLEPSAPQPSHAVHIPVLNVIPANVPPHDCEWWCHFESKLPIQYVRIDEYFEAGEQRQCYKTRMASFGHRTLYVREVWVRAREVDMCPAGWNNHLPPGEYNSVVCQESPRTWHWINFFIQEKIFLASRSRAYFCTHNP